MEAYFHDYLRLPLSPGAIQQMHRITQGWAAGVALFGSSMEQSGAEDIEQSFTPLLTQTNRYVFDFLTEEIINQERPEVRAFLLKTAVLVELTPNSCARLAGVAEGEAAALLEDLYRRNIFLAQVDPDTYRFHDLFAAYLNERLEKEMPVQVKDLYRQAAAEETNPRRQTALLARAGEWDAAAQCIDTAGETLLAQGSYTLLQDIIQLLPEAERARLTPPSLRTSLLYYEAICANQTWDFARARDLLQQAVTRLTEEGDHIRLGTALLSLATCLSSTGDFNGARAAMEQALSCPLQPHQTAHLRIARAWQRIAQGDWQGTNSDLDAMLAILEQETNPAALRIIAPQWHYLFGALPGGVRRVERYAQCCAAFTGDDLLRASALAQIAWARVWQGNWEDAQKQSSKAARISAAYGGLLWIDTDAGVLLAPARRPRRRYGGCGRSIPAAFRWIGTAAVCCVGRFLETAVPLFARPKLLAERPQRRCPRHPAADAAGSSLRVGGAFYAARAAGSAGEYHRWERHRRRNCAAGMLERTGKIPVHPLY